MNILFISSQKLFRGGEKQTLYLIDALQKQGIKCSISCHPNNTLFHKKIQENNIDYLPLHSSIPFLPYISYYKNYDIINTLDSKSTTLLISIIPFRKPLIYTRRVSYKVNIFSIIKLKLLNKIVVLTNYYKNYLERLGLKNISVIPDMVVRKNLNRERAKKILEELQITDNFIIGTISALDNSKDPFTLLKAFKKLSSELPKISVLHFGSGKLRTNMEKFIKENNLQNKYFLLGYVDNVEDFYSVFNLFVLCSKIEGMGSSILDSFLYKVPVIVSEIPSIKEYAYEKAIFFEKSSPDSLYIQLRNIIENKIELTKLKENAYNYVITHHSPEKITYLYLQEYNKLLKHSPKI